jgi:tetratricopeptide (TPR) repeat protein
MKKIRVLIFFLILSGAVTLTAGSIQTAFVVGKVYYRTEGAWFPLNPGTELHAKDFIKAEKLSSLILEINGRKIKIQGPNTFSVKELIKNLSAPGAFLQFSSERDRFLDRLIHRHPVSAAGVRGEKTDKFPQWFDESREDTLEKARKLLYNREYRKILSILNEESIQPQTHYYLGIARYQLGRHKESIKSLERFLTTGPADPVQKTSALYTLSLAHYYTGQYRETLSALEKITDKNSLPEILFFQAQCYFMLGKKDSALKKYREIVRQFPKHRLAVEAENMIQSLQESVR